NDGYLGNNPEPHVSPSGLVTGAGGYTTPNPLYNIPTPIIITAQPQPLTACEGQSAVLTIAANDDVLYQWQVSSDGVNFTDVTDNTMYSGSTTPTLTITAVTAAMQGYSYRVQLDRTGNVCG